MNLLLRFSDFIHHFLYRPRKVFWLCLCFVTLSLVFNGSLLRLYGLHRDYDRLAAQIISVETNISEMNQQLKMVQDPQYIERQARDRYDLVQENDLIFVFADE